MQRAHEEAERRGVRRRRRKRRLLAVLCVLVVGAPVGFAGWKRATAPPPPPKLRAQVVAQKGGVLAASSPPAAYRTRYKVETYPTGQTKGSKPAVTTEEVTVRRPFEGRIVEREGVPPGNALQLDIRSTLGLRGDYSKADAVQVTKQAPVSAVGDVRLEASLDRLVSGGFLKPRERRRVLGRVCQVYRTGLPLESLSVSAPSAQSYADSCVDASGLLLEELAVSGGKLTNRVTAIEVDEHPDLPADTFTIEGEAKGLDAGAVDLQAAGPATAPGPVPAYWRFAAPPPGFEDRGRFLLAAPDANGAPQARWVDVYAKGPDLLLVEQGTLAAEPQASVIPGQDLDEGPLGQGTLVPSLTGNVLTVHPGTGWFVQITATLAPDALQRAISALANG